MMSEPWETSSSTVPSVPYVHGDVVIQGGLEGTGTEAVVATVKITVIGPAAVSSDLTALISGNGVRLDGNGIGRSKFQGLVTTHMKDCRFRRLQKAVLAFRERPENGSLTFDRERLQDTVLHPLEGFFRQLANPLIKLTPIERCDLMAKSHTVCLQTGCTGRQNNNRRASCFLALRSTDRHHYNGSPRSNLVKSIVRHDNHGSTPFLLRTGTRLQYRPKDFASSHFTRPSSSTAACSSSSSRSQSVPAMA